MPKVNLDALTTHIRSLQTKKASGQGGGAVSVSENDSRASSAPAAPKTDGDDPSKLGVPSGSRPENAAGGVPDGVSNATGTGEDVPRPAVTTKPDEVPIDKQAAALAERISKFAESRGGIKSASADVKGGNIPEDKNASPAPKPTASAVEGIPAQQPKNANTTVADAVNADPDYFAKIGAAMLSTSEGEGLVRDYMRKQAGIQAADALVKAACEQRDIFVEEVRKSRELEKAAAERQQNLDQELENFFKMASTVQDRELIVKIASAHRTNLNSLAGLPNSSHLELLYKQGMADAAMMQQSMAGGGEPAIPGGDGVPLIEQIAQLLMVAVESGQVDEASATAALQALQGAAAGAAPGAPEGGAPAGGPEGGAGGEAPATPEGGEPAAPAEPAEGEKKETKEAGAATDIFREIIGAEFFGKAA